ncbi:uncharacterized protein LOC144364586 [Saccoglossus kowalevskii]
MKAMAEYRGVTLRISANVDPAHLDRAERYFKDTIEESMLFNSIKTTTVGSEQVDCSMALPSYLNLQSMTYPSKANLQSFRKSLYLLQQERANMRKFKHDIAKTLRCHESQLAEKNKQIETLKKANENQSSEITLLENRIKRGPLLSEYKVTFVQKIVFE